MRKLLCVLIALALANAIKAQSAPCTFKKAVVFNNFGTGNITDLNTDGLYNYDRVAHSCPNDGHYTYTSSTSNCFHGNWHNLTEDHTPDDEMGNMMLVNASYSSGKFLTTTITGLKSNTAYEFSVWMVNVCKISDRCPYPLLPRITIQLQTPDGTIVAQFQTGELQRMETARWTPYRALFTTPPAKTALTLTMTDNMPGGCGNDFALDDISFRECVKADQTVGAAPKTPRTVKPPTASAKPVSKKETPAIAKKQNEVIPVNRPSIELSTIPKPVEKPAPSVLPAPPALVRTRANPLVKQIETAAGEIKLELYDNGDVDGDTISIYHNNVLLIGHARLSQKAISLRITVDPAHPHHEIIMVAHNLGSIPPNTSLMVVTAANKRHEVFISSNEQKNAKVIIDLKE
ncbi:MAG TPA: hypothetical protein VF610_07060 [Segetibacter sp.]